MSRGTLPHALRARERIHVPTQSAERIADVVTAFVGSWTFIILHALWFTLWIAARVEPFPYGLLTMIVSLEAIFLSTLVMISQNRQGGKDRKRDDLESEEVTLLLQMNRQQLELLQLMRNAQAGMKNDTISEVPRD